MQLRGDDWTRQRLFAFIRRESLFLHIAGSVGFALVLLSVVLIFSGGSSWPCIPIAAKFFSSRWLSSVSSSRLVGSRSSDTTSMLGPSGFFCVQRMTVAATAIRSDDRPLRLPSCGSVLWSNPHTVGGGINILNAEAIGVSQRFRYRLGV